MSRPQSPPRHVRISSIRGNIVRAGAASTAWYVLPGQHWAWRDDLYRDKLIRDGARQYAALAGKSLHIRRTSRPWSPARWRAAMADTATRPLAGWDGMLAHNQTHLARMSLEEKVVMLGVTLDRPLPVLSQLFGPKPDRPVTSAELADIDRFVAGPGLRGRPATQNEVVWLVRRSLALGCGTPDERPETLNPDGTPVPWEKDDLTGLADTARYACRPFHKSFQVAADLGWPASRVEQRYVSVLTVGQMPDVWDSDSPWLSLADSLGFPVEMSVRVDVLPAKQAKQDVENALNRWKNQVQHYLDFNQPLKPALEEAGPKALDVQHDLERGLNDLATRTNVWARLEVSGESEAELEDRCRRLVERYAEAGIALIRGWAVGDETGPDQYAQACEFTPSEPLSTVANRRWLPVTSLAGGMVQESHEVGNSGGFYLGYTSQGSTRRPVLVDPWENMEYRDGTHITGSGLTVLTGKQGAGKSRTLGGMAYQVVMSGVRVVLMDPSGPLANLCALPEVKGRARHLDLLHAEPGSANPFQMIPEPRRSQHDTEAEYERAMVTANGERRQLAVRTLRGFLDPVTARMTETTTALRNATRIVDGLTTSSPRDVLAVLNSMGGHAKDIAGHLGDVADTPIGQLVFPYGETLDAEVKASEALLTVITMRGLQLPDAGSDREEWTEEQQMAVPLMHLAAYLTRRLIYESESMGARKFMGIDEAWSLTGSSTGKSFINVSVRETRKWNFRLWLASQNVTDLLAAGIANLTDSKLVGLTSDPDEQAANLRLLGVPTGVGYEAVLGQLGDDTTGAREFVYADGSGGVEKITVDDARLPAHVQTALESSPDGTSSASKPAARRPRSRTRVA